VILCTLIACGIGTLIWIVIPLVLPIRDKLHETYSGNMAIVRFVMFCFWSAIYFGLEALEKANHQSRRSAQSQATRLHQPQTLT
jgi:hypothetical protein